MENKQDLLRRFENAKNHMVMCDEKYETTEPTDKEVWGFMKSVAKLRMEEALADDMEGYVIEYQKRIKLIDEELEAIHINEQAELHIIQRNYEYGLSIN